MRSLVAPLLVAALVALGSATLLEMSQMLWLRLLGGGYRRVGRIDPLRVPLVKVDQSAGNTSYRVVLRDLEVAGLNGSKVESVRVVRGRLRSNLSDDEAGYVSYNEQRDLDSIRYRFHTLVKEPKLSTVGGVEGPDGRSDKIVEYDPMRVRVNHYEGVVEPFRSSTRSPRPGPSSNSSFLQQQQQQQEQQLQGQSNKDNGRIYGDMRVAMNGAAKTPASLHLVYSNNYKAPRPDSSSRANSETHRPCIGACQLYYQAQANQNPRAHTDIHPDQRYNAESASADYATKTRVEGPASSAERPHRFSFRAGDFDVSYVPKPTPGTFSGDGSERTRPVYVHEYAHRPTPPTANQYSAGQVKYEAATGAGSAEGTTVAMPSVERAELRAAPLLRLEKQSGYVDIVYAREGKLPGKQPQAEKLQRAPEDDPRAYGLAEIMKDLRGNQRYIIHNFTEGESLRKRNDAVRVAAESKRIKDLIRYAKEYEERAGYFEEGVEVVYHFGDSRPGSAANDTLSRAKRQHLEDKDEDELMHVVVRIRVPRLSVKSSYALTGKVDQQLLRGNGLLAGNFTDLVADFTVELKRVNNNTMIVRAARAKLTSKHHKIKLQGMDEKGPVEKILAHGLMAAEAVAAMIADDLATKSLNEGNAENVIYKMYQNLPAVQRV